MLLMLVILAVFIPSSNALTCYLCTSLVSSDCGETFKGSTLTCETEYACAKSIIGDSWVTRACVNMSDTRGLGFGCHSESQVEVCFCNTDKCNGAVMTSPLGHVIMMVVLLVNVIIARLL